jgi:6,7-dimethyl-8-ribityllumazine synthase
VTTIRKGNKRTYSRLALQGARFAVIATRYNEFVVDSLLKGCMRVLQHNGVSTDRIQLVRVPGAYELPFAARELAAQQRYHAIIALGAVIRGQTPHFDYICGACAKGLMDVGIRYGVPVAFGVITANNRKQALERASEGEESNKGVEAAYAAIEMVSLLRGLRK